MRSSYEQGTDWPFAVSDQQFEQLAQREQVELQRRELVYRGDARPLELSGKSLILVDDGLATGATMLAALRAARTAGAARVVVAAPVASAQAAERVGSEADDTTFVETPAYLEAIGQWYKQFEQVEDAEVLALRERARQGNPEPSTVTAG